MARAETRDESEARIAQIFERLRESQEALMSGRSSVTAQAMILAVWTEQWPVEAAIAMARFLNGGRVAMRERR